jgi:hypothetical protein
LHHDSFTSFQAGLEEMETAVDVFEGRLDKTEATDLKTNP